MVAIRPTRVRSRIGRIAVGAGRDIAQRRVVQVLAIALSVAAAIGTVPAWAQQRGNPVAGGHTGGGGPYGSDTGVMPYSLTQALQIIASPDLADRRRGAVGGIVQRDEAAGASEMPEANRGENPWENLFIGCTGGGFLGGFAVATGIFVMSSAATPAATAAAVPSGMALPALAGAIVSAAAIGCGIGISTAAVNVGAAALWRWLVR